MYFNVKLAAQLIGKKKIKFGKQKKLTIWKSYFRISIELTTDYDTVDFVDDLCYIKKSFNKL